MTTTKELENILIDILEFTPPLPMNYADVVGIFSSSHCPDCCEWHELDFEGKEEEFETVKQFLSKVDKIDIKGTPGMGITLRMYDGEKEFGLFIPGRGSNNGYYSDDLTLEVKINNVLLKTYNITEYQEVSG